MENKEVLNGVGLPGTTVAPMSGKEELTLPTKKGKSKSLKIFAGIAAILLVAGVAFGSYYFTANLNQASTPNAPDSEPMAAPRDDDGKYSGRVSSGRDIGNPAERRATMNQEAAAAEAKKKAAEAAAAALKDQGTAGMYTKPEKSTLTDGQYKSLVDAILAGDDLTTTGNATAALKALTGARISDADMKAAIAAAAKFDSAAKGSTVGKLCDGGSCDSVTQGTNDLKNGAGSTLPARSGFYVGIGSDGKSAVYIPIGTTIKKSGNTGGAKTTAACTATTWTPATNTVCEDVEFTQTSNCKTTRKATGTKDCSCTVSSWTPATNTVCEGEDFTQTSNCDTTRDAVGTKSCETGTPDLSATKMAYRNESSNSSGRYTLGTEIDKVSKDQVFVYAFEITNNGDGKANKVVLKDVLKGDNQEWLSYVDGESRCKYSASTRTVTCNGMTLEAGENDTYKFRVRVSGNATNGEIIKNVGVISYENMPNGGEAEASLELTVSSVVGCNKTCTSDEECSTGLTCDPESNTCRRPACTDATSCVCVTERVVIEEEPTPEPTERVIVVTQAPRRVIVKAAPTVLPETGILDFPGAAAFGGGLVLAVIGILLAL